MLPKPTLSSLGKLIPRLGSNHDGEVLATVSAIQRVLVSAGADLHDLSAALGIPRPAAPWREDVELCRRYWDALSVKEQGLIANLERWRGQPTEKQMAWLQDIAGRLRGKP